MIGTLWNNLADAVSRQILISSADTLANKQVIDCQIVYNRGEMVGIQLAVTNKVLTPGAGKNLRVYYAFSNYQYRTVAQMLTASTYYDCPLTDAADGNVQEYALPINYQGARYLYVWFTAEAFTNPTAKLELELAVQAKNMN